MVDVATWMTNFRFMSITMHKYLTKLRKVFGQPFKDTRSRCSLALSSEEQVAEMGNANSLNLFDYDIFEARLFRANKFDAGFVTGTFCRENANFPCDVILIFFFLPQQNLINNSIRNRCKVRHCLLKKFFSCERVSNSLKH